VELVEFQEFWVMQGEQLGQLLVALEALEQIIQMLRMEFLQ
jgi:hypothetical protein